MSRLLVLVLLLLTAGSAVFQSWGVDAAPSIYPTGTTIYQPDRTWNGYTVLNSSLSEVVLIDMNGNELHRWDGMRGYPPRLLPGGYLLGGLGTRSPHLETITFAQLDWDGNIVWKYDGTEEVRLENGDTVLSARQHHDWQREGSPVGYHAPGAEPMVDGGRTLVLSHKNLINTNVSDKRLEDELPLISTAYKHQCSPISTNFRP